MGRTTATSLEGREIRWASPALRASGELENLLAGPVGSEPPLASALVGTLSELCEMVGIVLIIEALLLHLTQHQSVSIAVSHHRRATGSRPA